MSMRRKITKSKDSLPFFPGEQPSEISYAEDGDVVLEIEDPRTKIERRYRCSRSILTSRSEYFNILFDPVKFNEGRATEAKLQGLYTQYPDLASMPSSRLPSVVISDVGELPKACASTSTIVSLFLKILHDPATPWPVPKSQSMESLALLAIVADRFAAIRSIREYLRGQKMDVTLLKDRRAATARQLELDNRQRVFAGFVFGFDAWVRQCSAALIIDGPTRHPIINPDCSDEEALEQDALWWRLPNNVEGTLNPITEAYGHLVGRALISRQKNFRVGANTCWIP